MTLSPMRNPSGELAMAHPGDDGNQMEERRATTDRRRHRREEQQQLRAIVTQLADGIVIVGADGRIRFANPAAEHLFGRSVSHLLGTQFGYPVANGHPAAIDVVRPGGATVAAELRVVDITWEGEPARLVSIRDITERRRAEERNQQLERERAARTQAEAANQAKSDLIATMSHELRTPLNAVLGYAELLDLGIGGSLGPEQRHQVDRIRASGRHLLGLVDQILDLAKVDAGRLSVEMGSFPATVTADAASALIQPVAEARGINFVERPGDGRVNYVGDEDRVRQILVNLLTNAVKFTEAGGTVTLEYGQAAHADGQARLHGHGPWTYFRVTDTGIGIPVDQLARIFQPFVQVETGHTRSKDGSGLGLTISRRLARLMRGDITVASTVGEGSAFTLWLPTSDEPELAEPAAEAEASARPEPTGGARRHRGLAELGECLLRELEPLLEAFVSRIRAECPIPGAATLKFSQLADHVASYVADVAGTLIALDESAGQPSGVVADAVDIHRLVASRHGAQRARLGWNEEAIRCEYAILRDELERVMQRHARAADDTALDEVRLVVGRFLEEAERTSVRALTRVAKGASVH
jgi:signal transduction histidine kinase